MSTEERDTRTYQVVVNQEGQHSIWLAERELPLGWRAVGKRGSKEECLAYIREVWTDMRPASLRS
ncbi:MbtH family protein [Andreprevotia chitinilytica]|uniref:MbtH family protein n=1 Tax=Andreprevotia chitinilytica TaxID=396808 RepID=UPI00054E9810|nr:MbtH family protein [Andreprevotia chitinilytica]